MPAKRTLFVGSVILLMLVLGTAGPVAGPAPAPPTLTTLQPGGFRTINQELDVNVVFVGYELGAGPRNINAAEFGNVLPDTYRPAHRYRSLSIRALRSTWDSRSSSTTTWC